MLSLDQRLADKKYRTSNYKWIFSPNMSDKTENSEVNCIETTQF